MKSQKEHYIYDGNQNVIQDNPWIFRTYGGHTNPKATNKLFRDNLAKGQTGLSIAFDLPTQCGYSSDHAMAKPEIGKVGVPINSIEDFRVLFDQIPIEKMNTSMTINGTSMWLLSLYIALAEERKIDISQLKGTTQNDLIKEFLARGTYIYPPDTSMSLIVDMYEYCLEKMPKWNPSNICSYHLQEAGATPVQELSFALSTAIAVLDAIKQRNCFTDTEFSKAVARISFFVNSGMRFIEEMCKMKTFASMWDLITQTRYNVKEPKFRRFRYGVQVNSLGLTEEQPENNAWRILIETLGVTLARDVRCRALQLPAWNEALSLPRPWDQQWSLRLQQILAYETDLLEYPDLFEGSVVIDSKVKELTALVEKEIENIEQMGGAIEAIKSGYMKTQLVKSNALRVSRIMTNETVVVGKNKFKEGITSPLVTDRDGGIFQIDAAQANQTLKNLEKLYQKRDTKKVEQALKNLEEDARNKKNLMYASIECAKVLVTTGEWSDTLKKVFGDYRPSTGIEGQSLSVSDVGVKKIRDRINAFSEYSGFRPKISIAKPGLDGHSNGAELISVAAKHCGFDVLYSGIRLTPEEIVNTAVEEGINLLAISLLSGSHIELIKGIMDLLKKEEVYDKIPVIIGGTIPEKDFEFLYNLGVKKIFTSQNFDLLDIMNQKMDIIENEHKKKKETIVS